VSISYLDSGLLSKGEHSYGMALALRPHLVDRFGSCEIFASKKADKLILAELDASPHFSRGLYDQVGPRVSDWGARLVRIMLGQDPSDLLISETASLRVLNATYQADLASLPERIWSAGNVVVIPGIMQHQLRGLIDHVATLANRQRPTVVCGLMFDPAYLPWGVPSKFGRQFYARCFDAIRADINKSIFFVTENTMMRDLYFDEFGVETTIVPIPLARRSKGNARDVGRPRLGFFGYSKSEKGFHLLPEALELVRKTESNFDVTIQVQHSGWEKRTIEAEEHIRRDTRNRILEGVLDQDRYLAETDLIDIMLLPYDPVRFGMRGSGIFTESVAAGRLVVAARGTYAAVCLEKGEAEGEVFAPYESAALANAILRLVRRFPEGAALTKARAAKSPLHSSAAVYADVIASLRDAWAA
jgi:glycosyltransferase involved in cell wall biosynthesis